MNILLSLAAIVLGIVIGYSFGFAQQIAQKRYAMKNRTGSLSSVWGVVPGSGIRVAYLLVLLVAVQLLCPLLFDGDAQWVVSIGVVLGYGWTLAGDLKRKMQTR